MSVLVDACSLAFDPYASTLALEETSDACALANVTTKSELCILKEVFPIEALTNVDSKIKISDIDTKWNFPLPEEECHCQKKSVATARSLHYYHCQRETDSLDYKRSPLALVDGIEKSKYPTIQKYSKHLVVFIALSVLIILEDLDLSLHQVVSELGEKL
nr:hypothetical protein [Tanacetum cinerariifolium]